MVLLENVLKISLQDVLKMSWRHLEDFFKTSWRRLEEVLKTFWRRLEDVFKTSWRCLEDVLKTSWRRLEDVLKTYGQDKYIGLEECYLGKFLCREKRVEYFSRTCWVEQINLMVLLDGTFLMVHSWRRLEDLFWRRRRKTSSRRLHQDECLLGSMLKKALGRKL